MDPIKELLHTWRMRLTWAAELTNAIEALHAAKQDVYLSTSSAEHMGSQRTTVSDPVARLAGLSLRYDRLIQEKEQELKQHLSLYDTLESAISSLPPVHRRVIDLRYRGLRQHAWEEIMGMICYSRASTYRIHDEALRMLEKTLYPAQHETFGTCNSFPAVVSLG